MDMKTMDTLRTMICGELDDIAKKGLSNHEVLDIMKDLLDSLKNIEKIEKYRREKEEGHMEDMGYSQRSMGRYYVDGTYDRGGYRGQDWGNSYKDYPMMYDGGNSYTYREPAPEHPMSYAGAPSQSKEELLNELRRMMGESADEKVRATISEIMMKVK